MAVAQKRSRPRTSFVTIELPCPDAEPLLKQGGNHICEIRYARLLRDTSSQAWLKVIDMVDAHGLGQDGVSITLDVDAIGKVPEDQREQAKAALAAYGDMLTARELLDFQRIADEGSGARPPRTLAAVTKALEKMYNAPVPPNGRIVGRSNMAEYAKEQGWNIRPDFWDDYVELTPEELAEESKE